MSKTNPSQAVETRAELSRQAVVTVLVIKTRTVNSVRTRYPDYGTGFVIKSYGGSSIVLTANHVVEDLKPEDKLYVRNMLLDGGVEQRIAHVLYGHPLSDIAVLRVQGLQNVEALVFEPTFANGDSVICVAYANPLCLFPGIPMACKRSPDLSPGNIIEREMAKPLGPGDVSISTLHMEMTCVKGMSGGAILSATGVIGMFVSSYGAQSKAVSYDTILQVLKRYYRIRLREARPTITDVQMDAHVDPMTMHQLIDMLS